MQKPTSIFIPKPCHEDWNKMTPTQQGRFCSACNKQVVDFSLMSDNQVLNFLSNQSGKLCGRFDAEQLQRPLIETKIKKKKSWWMALTMPLLFLFDKSEAQSNQVLVDTTTYFKTDTAAFMGAVMSVARNEEITVRGKVVDQNGEAVPFATIKQKKTKKVVAADADGNFSIIVEKTNDDVILTSSAVGLETTDQKINFQQDSTTVVIKMNRTLTGDIVVTVGFCVKSRPVKTIDTLHSTVKKLFGIAMVKLYPNPVINNSIINLQIKSAGNYQMQLLNNQSQLMQTEEINVDAKNSTRQIQLQSNIAAGIYYLRLINEQTKKQYTEKLIVQ